MTVPTIDYGDELGLRRHVQRNTPVVVGGLGADRAAVLEWTAESLRSALGSQPVPVIESRSPYLSYERNVQDMPFDQFVERCFGTERGDVHLYFKNSTDLLPGGMDDSDRLTRLAPYICRAMVRNLWISGPGLTVGLHFDPAENLNIQLRGRKRFMLYPPGVRSFYPMPLLSQTSHISRVFREGPELDAARFPRFDPRAATEVTLEEGQVLYLPAYWWHRVDSLGEENINLNFWWLPDAAKQALHPSQALRGYVGLLIRRLKFGSIAKAAESGDR